MTTNPINPSLSNWKTVMGEISNDEKDRLRTETWKGACISGIVVGILVGGALFAAFVTIAARMEWHDVEIIRRGHKIFVSRPENEGLFYGSIVGAVLSFLPGIGAGCGISVIKHAIGHRKLQKFDEQFWAARLLTLINTKENPLNQEIADIVKEASDQNLAHLWLRSEKHERKLLHRAVGQKRMLQVFQQTIQENPQEIKNAAYKAKVEACQNEYREQCLLIERLKRASTPQEVESVHREISLSKIHRNLPLRIYFQEELPLMTRLDLALKKANLFSKTDPRRKEIEEANKISLQSKEEDLALDVPVLIDQMIISPSLIQSSHFLSTLCSCPERDEIQLKEDKDAFKAAYQFLSREKAFDHLSDSEKVACLFGLHKYFDRFSDEWLRLVLSREDLLSLERNLKKELKNNPQRAEEIQKALSRLEEIKPHKIAQHLHEPVGFVILERNLKKALKEEEDPEKREGIQKMLSMLEARKTTPQNSQRYVHTGLRI